jgi:uncharacterized protein (DUF305 family)
METKPLLYGLIGFFLGGLIVSIAATTFERSDSKSLDMSMSQMAEDLKDKQGDEFDKAFISGMIEHHEGAIEMAKLSAQRAKHDQLKQLSSDIISAQESEITEMKRWQTDWGYSAEDTMHTDNATH